MEEKEGIDRIRRKQKCRRGKRGFCFWWVPKNRQRGGKVCVMETEKKGEFVNIVGVFKPTKTKMTTSYCFLLLTFDFAFPSHTTTHLDPNLLSSSGFSGAGACCFC